VIVARTIKEARAALRSAPRPLGFVPTMGALHDGHLALVEAANTRCANVAASVFVNPTQFGAGEDYAEYPRDEARDLGLLEAAGRGLVYAPAPDEMYPDGFATDVRVGGTLTESFEGAERPAHFDGMTLVVTKLLSIVCPDVLFLGEKDAQQLAIARRFVRDLDLPVEVAGVPTVREQDGLAMSSRNAYLTPDERRAAPDLYTALLAGRAAAGEPGSSPAEAVEAVIAAVEPSRLSLDYVAAVHPDSFETAHTFGSRSLLIAAARLGSIRLIDNISLASSAYPTKDATQ
jgi:pantoate--beta-alanine ligase